MISIDEMRRRSPDQRICDLETGMVHHQGRSRRLSDVLAGPSRRRLPKKRCKLIPAEPLTSNQLVRMEAMGHLFGDAGAGIPDAAARTMLHALLLPLAENLTPIEKALQMLLGAPPSVQWIADRVGVTRQFLYGHERFRAAWKAHKSTRGPGDLPRGSKSRDGDLEAIDDES